MSRLSYSTLVICMLATPAAAQLPHPDCAKLPGGGKIRVETPGIFGPPACHCGLPVPPNAVLGFSDRSRQTCEFKVNGQNTGQCKADTTCAPGTTRVQQNGVWGCQAPSTFVEVSCPAPPTVSAPAPPRSMGPPQVPPACAQIKTWEARLAQRANEHKAAVGRDAAVRGPAAAESVEHTAGAAVLFGVAMGGVYADLLPLWTVQLAKCDDVDRSNPVASAECDKSIRDYEYSRQRLAGLSTRFDNAVDRADRALGQLRQGGDDPAGKAARAAQDDLKEAQRQLEACLADMDRAFKRPR